MSLSWLGYKRLWRRSCKQSLSCWLRWTKLPCWRAQCGKELRPLLANSQQGTGSHSNKPRRNWMQPTTVSLEADPASGEPSCNCGTRWHLDFRLRRDPESGHPARQCPDSKPTETGHGWKSLTLGLFATWQWTALLLSLSEHTWYVPFVVSSKIVQVICRSSYLCLQDIEGLTLISGLRGSAAQAHKEICDVSRTFQQSSHYDSIGQKVLTSVYSLG